MLRCICKSVRSSVIHVTYNAIKHVSDNPVLCDERLYELMTVLESLNARVSGVSACAVAQTTSPMLMRALNDALPEAAPIVVLRSGEPVQPSQLLYRRVGALIGQVLPEREGTLPLLVEPPITLPPASSNVVVKWPDERRSGEHAHIAHPLTDHLRFRDKNDSPR